MQKDVNIVFAGKRDGWQQKVALSFTCCQPKDRDNCCIALKEDWKIDENIVWKLIALAVTQKNVHFSAR